MSMTAILALAFSIGIVAGLRSFTAPAAVCWAAHLGWLHLDGSKLAFLGTATAVYISSALAVVELVLDKQPWIGARTKPGRSARARPSASARMKTPSARF